MRSSSLGVKTRLEWVRRCRGRTYSTFFTAGDIGLYVERALEYAGLSMSSPGLQDRL